MSPRIVVHDFLRQAREVSDDGRAWLDRLPGLVTDTCRRWELQIAGPPYEGGVCGWVAPVRHRAGDAVLKITWPHPEAAMEGAALRWWDGSGAVRLLAEDTGTWALLLERCEPGTPLREARLPYERGLQIAADVLDALWKKGVPGANTAGFDDMGSVCDGWADLSAERAGSNGAVLSALGVDPGVVDLGIGLLRELPRSAARRVVVHGDANPGNLLASRRGALLAIDPKPMVGDPAFDPWSVVAQLDWPFRRADAAVEVPRRVQLFAERLGLEPQRIAAWGVARDVEGGLWAASVGRAVDGAKWIRSATIIAAMLD